MLERWVIRYLFGFLCVCVLGVVANCGEPYPPVITNIAWATVGACTQGTASDYTITITATGADTDPTDLTYIGDVPGCLGAIDAAVSTITCPNVAPFPGTVVAEVTFDGRADVATEESTSRRC